MSLDDKIIELNENIKNQLNILNYESNQIQKSKTTFLNLKDIFSAKFSEVVNDIQLVLNNITKENKDNLKELIESKENESPASKITMLSLNWLDEGKSTKCNEVRNKRHNINNYWLARSEEILDGAFMCKILVENITGNKDWHHGAGLIKFDKNVNENGFYGYASILFMSSSKFNSPFNRGSSITNYPEKWKNGDEILIKRDHENNIWFGLNDESKMVKSCTEEGKFRIVLGFLNKDKENEVFKMIYIQKLE